MSILPSLFFTVDVNHAHDLSATLRANGIKCYPISGQTPDDEEERFIRLFNEGAIDGLASCQVISEGFDAPAAMGAFMCRPTKSGLLFRQQIGRVLRPFPAPQGPRPYQQECLDSILTCLREGINLQLAVLPTGTGKTFISANVRRVVEQWKGRKMKRILFLVHLDNLVNQTADAFRRWCPDLTVGVEKGGGFRAGDADVVVASVQCIGNGKVEECDGDVTFEYSKRLLSFDPSQFDVVVVDEIHHAGGRGVQYRNIMRYFGVLKGDAGLDRQKLMLGVTATPQRRDNIGLESVCDKICYEYPLRSAIKQGYLSDLRAFRVETHEDISAVKSTAGDLNIAQLGNAVNTPERNALVAREYLRIRDLVAPDLRPGVKPYCVVVDFVDNSGRHSIIGAASLFGLRETFDLKGKPALEVVEEVERLESENPTLDLRAEEDLESVQAKVDRLKTSLHKIDLLRPPETPEALRGMTHLCWLQEASGAFRLGALDGSMYTVREDTLGAYAVYRHVKGIRTHIHTAKTIEEAVKEAERRLPERDAKIMAAGAAWRSEPPSEPQIRLLFTLDRKLRTEFRTAKDLYDFAIGQFHDGSESFSRGSISIKIDSLRAARQ